MFRLFGRRSRRRTIYSLFACLFIIIYAAITENQEMSRINNEIKTAMESNGEMPSDKSTGDIVSNIDQPTLEILSKGIYKNKYEKGKKLVLYSGNNKVMALYEQSPDWTKKFSFVKVNTSELEGAYSLIKKPCNGICIIDFEKKKLYSIPQNKTNDNNYIYDVFSKCYN